MKRTLRAIAAFLIITAAMLGTTVTAFADKLKTLDGITYRFSDSGEQTVRYTGWAKTAKGRRYYKNGVPCRNKWQKFKSGKYYYFDADGYMTVGWAHIEKDWYYITDDKGRLTGTQIIDGTEYNFDDKGRWDKKPADSTNEKHSSIYDVYFRITNGRYNDIYGGAGMPDGMLVIWSVNGQAEKMINERYPGIGGIVYMPASYSVTQLEKARSEIKDFIERDKNAGNMSLWYNGPATYTENNRLVLEASQEQYDCLSSFIGSLPDKECIDVRLVEITFSDD